MTGRPLTRQELAAQAAVLVELLERLPALAADTDLNPGVLAVTTAVDQMYRQVADTAAGAPDLLVALGARVGGYQGMARHWQDQADDARTAGAFEERAAHAARAELCAKVATDLEGIHRMLGGGS